MLAGILVIATLAGIILKLACVNRFDPDRKKAMVDMVGMRNEIASRAASGTNRDFSKRHDPWATPYRITTTGTNTEVRSAGPDKKFGTPDDIVAP